MTDFRVDKITNRNDNAGSQIAGITTFSGTSGMQFPSGPTEYRGGRGRGVFFGGYEVPSPTSEIQYITIATTGDGADFGDCRQSISSTGTCASSTRGISGGGSTPISPGRTSAIDYVVMSSLGGASIFGELTTSRRYLAAFINSTRGVFCGGNNPSNTPSRERTIDYITMASTGDASDFGELGVETGNGSYLNDDMGGCSSPTRGLLFGGGNTTNVIQYLTIATLGNTKDFGDLTEGNIRFSAASSNSVRGINAGGNSPSTNGINTMEYVTIATLGNAANFGDLSVKRSMLASLASSTRGIFAGGYIYPSPAVTYNTIDYVSIASTGDAQDFGDLTYAGQTNGANRSVSGCSDVNGGLG